MDYADAWIVIGTYNECENLPALIAGVTAYAPGAHLVIVDDASPDGTGELADELAREHGEIEVLHRQSKAGHASALIAGMRLALDRGARRIVTMDADLSHGPAALPAILAGLHGYDLVIGSRYVPGGGTVNWGWTRRVLSRFGSGYARALLGLRQRDCTGAFRGYRRELIECSGLLGSQTRGYGFQVEALYRCHRAGARVLEVPITFADRRYGELKLSRAIIVEAALLPWRMRFSAPRRQADGGGAPSPGAR